MTVALEAGKDTMAALSNKVTFVALAIDKDGKVKLTDVRPTSDGERAAVGEAVGAAATVFKAKAKLAKLPKDLSTYAKTLTGAYPTTKSGEAWTWQGKTVSMLRKVGAFWVVIEIPADHNGIFATILTDAWE